MCNNCILVMEKLHTEEFKQWIDLVVTVSRELGASYFLMVNTGRS